MVAQQGVVSIGGATVPLYSTFGEESLVHILNETKATAVLCCACTLERLLCDISPRCAALRTAIAASDVGEPHCSRLTKSSPRDSPAQRPRWARRLAVGDQSHPRASQRDPLRRMSSRSATLRAPRVRPLITPNYAFSSHPPNHLLVTTESTRAHANYLLITSPLHPNQPHHHSTTPA